MCSSIRLGLLFSFVMASVTPVLGDEREEAVRSDREKVEAEGFWRYNDIPGAFEEAERTGKPIVVVLRCLPCEECVKLDDELVDTDPVIRPLLEKFVCVRQVATNGLDLDLFQYDTDQSFAMFFLAADKTIYGRFGTRSHRTEWYGDVSLKGLAKALQRVLEMHEQHDEIKASLGGKSGKPLEFTSPEKYPTLKDKFTDRLNYEGDVVKSCIHCHQIGDARRDYYWQAKKPIPDKVLWPYPHPKMLGLIMDPNELATIKEVTAGSIAQQAGFRKGDVIESLNGQPLLSIADIQWVLDQVDSSGGDVVANVVRQGRKGKLNLKLEDGWRKAGDLSWRVSTWGLRRMAAGGMVLDSHDDGLFVRRVGKYGAHGAAKRTGIREGDVITSFDGRQFDAEQDLLTYVVQEKQPGQKVPVVVNRGGKQRTFQLPIQK